MAEEKDRDQSADLKNAEKQREQAEMRKHEEAHTKRQEEEAKRLANEPVVIVGLPGEAFNIRSAGLGSLGNMSIGGVPVKITRWDDNQIRGVLPAGAEGTVMLNGVARGVYPPVRPTTLPVAPVAPIPVVVVEPDKAVNKK
jgi:hypothetical protein